MKTKTVITNIKIVILFVVLIGGTQWLQTPFFENTFASEWDIIACVIFSTIFLFVVINANELIKGYWEKDKIVFNSFTSIIIYLGKMLWIFLLFGIVGFVVYFILMLFWELFYLVSLKIPLWIITLIIFIPIGLAQDTSGKPIKK